MKWEQLRAPSRSMTVVRPNRPRYLPVRLVLGIVLALILGVSGVAILMSRVPEPMIPVVHNPPPTQRPGPGTKEYRTPNAIIRFADPADRNSRP
jgi:hypothetical protein